MDHPTRRHKPNHDMADQPRYAGRISDWIIYKDRQVIAFNKPGGLPVQPDRSESGNLLSMAAAYAHHDLYLIHRLDRPVSGVVLLGQKPSAQTALTEQFKAGTVEKIYLALVAERPERDEATLVHYLRPGKGNKTHVEEAATAGAQEARLEYVYRGASDNYHLLEVRPLTGRKHQIRAQLAHIGCPIYGDVKYGFRRAAPDRTIGLHAYSITYDHPGSGKRTEHLAPPPAGALWDSFGLG